jgi:hypothetical protein
MAQTVSVQYQIKQYGLQGNGAGALGALPYQLIIHFLSESEASVKNVFLGDFDTIAHAKYAAVAFLTNGWVTGTFSTADTYWSPAAAVTTAAEVLSTVAVFTLQES